MKKVLTLLLVVIALSSCSTNVDRAFKLYIQQEEAKAIGDSDTYNKKKDLFRKSALLLDTDELGELDRLVKEYEGDQAYLRKEMATRKRMVDDILN